ncbi:MAG: NAD(P)H-hydrate dehydratase [Woeseiaceae bacterium]
MNSLPVEIYSVAAVREIDRTAIEEKGIPGYTLMGRAAAFAVATTVATFPDARRWQIFCGAGNNAGDGYVAARLARAEGIEVSVQALVDPSRLSGDAVQAYNDYVAVGGEVTAWRGKVDPHADLYVDALLGSGLDRELAGDFAAAVAALNRADSPVVALDISTGLHGDTGLALGDAVRADLTVTFVGLKQGQFLGRGSECRGLLRFSDLDIPGDCYADKPVEMRRIQADQPADLLPRRDRNAHKGDFGHVLIIGGGRGMPGAAVLCGEAALRTGAGRVSVATDPSHAASVVNDRPELMARGVSDPSELETLFENCSVLAVGPGLGQTEWARAIMAAVQQQSMPAVWDADALNWLAENPGVAEHRIITPHPGEAATLLGESTAAIQADRRGAVAALQSRYGGVAVLKGAGSLVKGPTSDTWISTSGNPGMAAPGMGDVLTGIIAALLGQGLSLLDAATAGVEIHAQVGDIASQQGERGMLASDVLAELRGVVNQ